MPAIIRSLGHKLDLCPIAGRHRASQAGEPAPGLPQPAAVDSAPVEVSGLEAGGDEAVEGDGENLMLGVFVDVLVSVGHDARSSLMR